MIISTQRMSQWTFANYLEYYSCMFLWNWVYDKRSHDFMTLFNANQCVCGSLIFLLVVDLSKKYLKVER